MKKINEMSIVELMQHKELMETIDSPEAKKLTEEIRNELDKREAEAEAKRKEAEAKKAAEETKKVKEAEKAADDLVEKQKSVLGKCYKKVYYDTNYLMPTVHYTVWYKVLGVYEEKAIVSFVKKFEYSNMVTKAVTVIDIDDLFNKNERYEEVSHADFNDKYVKTEASFEHLANVFNKFLQFPF